MCLIGFVLDWQLPMQSVPITTKVVSSNPFHGEVYSIQLYVIKFVSDLRQISGFLPALWFSSTNKTDSHDITESGVESGVNHHKPNQTLCGW